MKQQVKISGPELAADVRAGLDDHTLTQKYGASIDALRILLRKLVDEGLVSEMELYERRALSDSDVFRAFSEQSEKVLKCPVCGHTIPEGDDYCPHCENATMVFDLNLVMENLQAAEHDLQLGGEEADRVQLTDLDVSVALLDACKTDPAEEVDRLISVGAQVNYRDERGETPLLAAASKGRLDVVTLLLRQGADVRARDRQGLNALTRALSGGHKEVAQLLHAHGVSAQAHRESFSGSLVARRDTIISLSARPHVPVAAASGLPPRAPFPKELPSAGLYSPEEYKETRAKALAKAASFGAINHLRLLLDKGVPVDSVSRHGNTPLMRAAFKGQTASARLLLARGANVNAENLEGNSSLMLAAAAGHEEMVELLLGSGAAANTTNSEGLSSLIFATSQDRPDIVEHLLRLGAHPDLPDKHGDTPLMRAAEGGNHQTAVLLMDADANLDAQNRFGNTALMKASFRGHVDMAKLLLDRGADVNAINVYGITALMKAAHKGHAETVSLLLGAGADVDAEDKQGNSALSRAADRGNTTVVTLLRERPGQTEHEMPVGTGPPLRR